MKRSSVLLLTLFLAAAALVTGGCDRNVESSEPVRSLPDFDIVPEDIRLSLGNNSITVSWSVESMTDVASFNIYLFDSTYTAELAGLHPIRKYNTTGRTITIDSLVANRIYRVVLTAVSTAGFEGDRSEAAEVRPSYFSIRLDGGEKYTNSTSVDVRINSPLQATHMKISEDSSFADASYVPYQANSLFELADGDGTKDVFVRLLFRDGSETSSLLHDDIILDTEIDIAQVLFLGPATVSAHDTVKFQVISFETEGTAYISFGTVSNVKLNDDGVDGDATAGDGTYSFGYEVPENMAVKDALVIGRFVDRAGNQLTKNSSFRLTISSPPDPVKLSASLQTDSTVLLTWTESEDQDFAHYTVLQQIGFGQFTSIAIINSRSTTEHTAFLQTNTLYSFKVVVYNDAGESAESVAVSVQGP